MTDNKIIKLASNQEERKNAEDELRNRLKEVLYEYDGRITVASALGVLKIIENDFLREQKL